MIIRLATILTVLMYCLSAKSNDFILELSDPVLMEELEKSGFSFSEVLESKNFKDKDNAFLYGQAFYKSIADSLILDLNEKLMQDPLLDVTMAKSHRLFDGRWLKSKFAKYELAGIINRTDRLSFEKNKCGEVRFIYRLAYKKSHRDKIIYSRLPLTFNIVYWQQKPEGSNCKV